jgi:hypothetical protein
VKQGIKFQTKVHFRTGRSGRNHLETGAQVTNPVSPGRVPRLSRLMALAIRFEQLIHDGEVTDYAELARLGHVTRARITQVMNLLLLAPDIQEQILFLPRIEHGRDRIHLRQLQPIAQVLEWRKQRRLWQELKDSGTTVNQQ